MAKSIPKTFVPVTGFPNTSNEIAMTNILLLALATAYVKGDTNDNTLNATMFCNQFSTPSANSSKITLESLNVCKVKD